MYKLLIQDWETHEIVELKSPIIPVFRQSITFFDKDGYHSSRVVRFVDYVFNKEGLFDHILIYVVDEVEENFE